MKQELYLLIPEIALALSMLTVFISAIFIKNRTAITILALSGGGITFLLLQSQMGTAFNGMFRTDSLIIAFKSISLLALSLVIILSHDYKRIEDSRYGEFCTLIMLSTLGMMFLSSSGDMLILYLSLELMSLSIYVLTCFLKDEERSNEAALKYFLLGTLASIMFLLSIALVYGITGTTDFIKIGSYIKSHGIVSNPLMLFAVAFAIASFAFKISAVPFHQWSPDAYEGSPTTITAFISVAPKAAAFAAFGRLFYDSFMPFQTNWTDFLIIISILSMAVGNFLAISQKNIKRMLAYSSIAHAGYMLLGIISGAQEGLNGIIFYLAMYLFMNIGAFGVIIFLETKGIQDKKKDIEIDDLKGLSGSHPFLSIAMLIFMFSLVGIPPTAGFVIKMNIFMIAVQAGYTWLVVFAVIFSIISAYYYLRIVVNMFMKEPHFAKPSLRPPASLSMAIIIAVLMITILGIMPSLVLGI